MNKAAIARSFSKAACQYDTHAVLQQEVAFRLLENVSLLNTKPKSILDLGCGTGANLNKLQQLFPDSHIIGLDIAQGMLNYSKQKYPDFNYICADAENLATKDNQFDLIFANCTLQWCTNLSTTIKNIFNSLSPNGCIFFSSFGPNTLIELKQSFQQIGSKHHVHDFIDMHIIGDILLKTGFDSPIMHREDFYLTYDSVIDLMRDIKALGAHNQHPDKTQGLMGKTKLTKLEDAYKQFLNQDRLYPATYEVIYGHCFKKPISHQQKAKQIDIVTKAE